MKYKIIAGKADRVEMLVNKYLNRGWELGSFVMGYGNNYCQTVILKGREK